MNNAQRRAGSPRIVVVGSINMDLVARVDHLPTPGETVPGFEFRQIPGGKGANQAVAAARLGAACVLVGRVGDDGFANSLLDSLGKAGVDTERVLRTPDCPSGLAWIGVDSEGQNAITVVAGANGQVTPRDVQAAEPFLASAQVILLQLEIPLETVAEAIHIARKHRVKTVLDPAPAVRKLPAELYQVDVLCPNELEAETLTGIPVRNREGVRRAAHEICRRGTRIAMITLGGQGAYVLDSCGGEFWIPSFPVRVVDTTAAGDAFAGALGLALAEDQPFPELVRFACAAGACAATRYGAQPAMPTRAEVEQLLQERTIL